MASYAPGDRVHVALFGKGIVREVRNNGRFLVEIKGRAMEVADTQLSPVETPRAAGRRKGQHFEPASGGSAGPGRESRGAVVSLDLHGHTVEEALDALDRCLSDALLAGASELRVIHGKSGGKIKAAVLRRLRELPGARHVRLDPQNTGVTIVAL